MRLALASLCHAKSGCVVWVGKTTVPPGAEALPTGGASDAVKLEVAAKALAFAYLLKRPGTVLRGKGQAMAGPPLQQCKESSALGADAP